ncbi:MAG: hypothetical protein KA042_14575 [Saprospiraceae bacterium]|jgi:hypothetical protein|nr:hypothetical protein [Saprospiraceae bacterium]
MKFYVYSLLILSAFIFACKSGDSSEDKKREESSEITESDQESLDRLSEKMDEKSKDIKDALQKALNTKAGDLVSISDLREVFPSKVDGMARNSIKGEGVGAFGFKMNNVKSEYEDGDKRIKFELIDFGGFSPALVGLAAWSVADFYREDEDGFERVDTWKGYKSFEKSDSKNHTSSISIIVKDRIILNANADHMSLDDLKEAIDDDLLDEIESLKFKENN